MDVSAKYPKHFASKFRVNRAAAQIIPSGAWTLIQWDNQEFDTLEEMPIIAPFAFTPNKAGYYLLIASAGAQFVNIGDTLQISFYLNGVANIAGSYDYTSQINQWLTPKISAIRYLTPNDAVDLRVLHTAGVNRIFGNLFYNYFCGLRVG